MTDQEYFTSYKQSLQLIYENGPDDLVYLKDHNFKYQFFTAKFLAEFGIDDVKHVVGRSAAEIASKYEMTDEVIIEQFKEQDISIATQAKRKSFLEVLSGAGKPMIVMVHKTPIFNPATGNFVGIRGEINNVYWPHVAKTLFKIHGSRGLLINKDAVGNPLKKYPLNNIQHTVLFLCLNNYSYSEIALLMNEFGYEITPIRVNDYLEQLKLIFHVRNKTQLIEKAIGLNFHLYLPSGLFDKFTSIEVGSDVVEIVAPSS